VAANRGVAEAARSTRKIAIAWVIVMILVMLVGRHWFSVKTNVQQLEILESR
jgi:hypothetical protein